MLTKYKQYTPIFEDLSGARFMSEGSVNTGKRRGGTWDRAGKTDTGYEESLHSKLKRERRENPSVKSMEYGLTNLAADKLNFEKTLRFVDNIGNQQLPEGAEDAIIDKMEFRIVDDFFERRLPKIVNGDFLPTNMDKVVICTGEMYVQVNGIEQPLYIMFEHDTDNTGNRFCFIVDRPSGTIITIKIVPGEYTTEDVAKYINQDPTVKGDDSKQIHPLGVYFDKRRNVFAIS